MRILRIGPTVPTPEADAEAGCIVLLPAARQRLEDFIDAGFDRALQARGAGFELILVDPMQSHLNDRSWMNRLRNEVVLPLQATARPLWLGGISLGAFMALRFAASAPQTISGLCLIAPYLGSRIVAAEIARHADLRAWTPGELSEEDDERIVWGYVRGLRTPPPQLFLGLGREDRFADTQQLLARSVPPACCLTLEGGHEWQVWRRLWDNFLERHLVRSAQSTRPNHS
jgi:pimeloyl-ACP methyl ester carboxylesterase